MYRSNLKSVALPVPEITATAVLGGVANTQSWEEEAVGGQDCTVRKSVGEWPPQ